MSTEAREYRGYEAAAKYLGLKRNTLSSYVARGIGPVVSRREVEGQYVIPIFAEGDLDQWAKDRPGQGARTDLPARTGDEDESETTDEPVAAVV